MFSDCRPEIRASAGKTLNKWQRAVVHRWMRRRALSQVGVEPCRHPDDGIQSLERTSGHWNTRLYFGAIEKTPVRLPGGHVTGVS